MAHKRAVLGPLNGSLAPRVLFIGEAPGRLGADRTRRPFSGDASGRHFDTLLGSAGLDRKEIFITNAVLCCPADDRRNHTPGVTEIRNCRPLLKRTLALLKPPVVATVGAVALRALGRLIDREFKLAEVAGTMIETDEFLLVPLYHPSPRVLHVARSLDQQRADFAVLGVVFCHKRSPDV
jgi:DNA polymerase